MLIIFNIEHIISSFIYIYIYVYEAKNQWRKYKISENNKVTKTKNFEIMVMKFQ